MVWAISKSAVRGRGTSIPDMLAAAERDMPPGFFSLDRLIVRLSGKRREDVARGEESGIRGVV